MNLLGRSNRNVVVLGCGPAGLFAAHAAKSRGANVTIISQRRRSEMYGAQYLHTGIPGLTDDQKAGSVEYRLMGDLDDYLEKVYGSVIPERSAISKDSLVGIYPAWDIRKAYHAAFDRYRADIISNRVTASDILDIIVNYRPTLLISTIPAPEICASPELHAFDTRKVYAIGDAPERGVFTPRYSEEPNVIWYNGDPAPAWYRYSLISGYAAMEWPETVRPPVEDVAEIAKPIATTCDCWMRTRRTKVIRLGRYGAWSRHGHAHQAYWRTLATMKEMGI